METTTTVFGTSGSMYPDFVSVVDSLIQSVEKKKLEDLRKDFHTRMRITLTQPEQADLIEDLWDFFYDWCVFEGKLSEALVKLPENTKTTWQLIESSSVRGLFQVSKVSTDGLGLKELYTGKSYKLSRQLDADFIGISKGDIIECRLMAKGPDDVTNLVFVRKPSFHPIEVHDYLKTKVKQFKKAKDIETYQSWLWLVVGMYLKHRIYPHMPIVKIYDDNSRI